MTDQGAELYRAATWAAHTAKRRYPRQDFDDLLSDACLGAAHALRRFVPERGHLFGYAYRRALGAALDGARRRMPLTRAGHPRDGHAASLEDVLPFIPEPRAPNEYEQVDDADAVERILAQLPPRWAFVLREHDLYGTSLAVLAGELGIAETSVCRIRRKALARARAAA